MSTTAPARSATSTAVSNQEVPGCSVEIATVRFNCAGVGCASGSTNATYSCGMTRQTRSSAGAGKVSIERSTLYPYSRRASPNASRISPKKTFSPLAETRHIRGSPPATGPNNMECSWLQHLGALPAPGRNTKVPAMRSWSENLSWLRDGLNRSLFPPAPDDALRFRGGEAVVGSFTFLALAAVLQFLRAGPTESTKALFAEDGPVYLGGALTHGFFDSLTSPYAEYLVVIPRLIGEVATIPPLRYAPETMNVGAVLIVAVSGLAVWVASAGLIRSVYLRVLLVALVLIPPTSGLETVVSATTVAWHTSFAVFWLLLWRPEADWSAGLGALLILATGLSSPTVFFFVPLAVLRTIAIRNRRDAFLAGAFALALAVQLPVTALSSEQ